MTTKDTKIEAIMRELSHVHTSLTGIVQDKFRIRGWTITIFSGVLALSIHQDEKKLILIAIFAVILFWIFDAMHHAAQRLFYRREKDLYEVLYDPSDERIEAFKPPQDRDHFSDFSVYKKSFFSSLKQIYISYFYGSMLVFAIFACLFL